MTLNGEIPQEQLYSAPIKTHGSRLKGLTPD